MPPAFRRGWEGEGKLQIDVLARASGRQPATRGRLFAVSGTRGRSPWRSRARIATAIRRNNGTLAAERLRLAYTPVFPEGQLATQYRVPRPELCPDLSIGHRSAKHRTMNAVEIEEAIRDQSSSITKELEGNPSAKEKITDKEEK